MESLKQMNSLRMPSGLTAMILATSFALAGCGGFNGAEQAQFGADYMHPISVQQDVPTLNVGANGKLMPDDRSAIAGFAAAYKERGHGQLTVATPSGSANTTIAMDVLVEIRDLLAKAGVAASKVAYTPYRASGANERAPIVLSYKQFIASASPCGIWDEDYAYIPNNTPPSNLGCATQNNLAAMIADPADLVTPRVMTASDAQRRGQVFEKYRKGEITATARDQHDSVALSEVSK